jgi:cytochrome oxidase Cu insertion factor (SCO1/SenC/PrrC family)
MNEVTMKLSVALIIALLSAAAAAHNENAPTVKGPSVAPAPAPTGTRDPRAYFTDLELRTQDDRPVRFYTDTMEGRTVVLNIIYTNCKDACPLITQKMLRVRDLVGEAFGKDIYFITLTSDPERDSPAAMKRYAQKQSADLPGWLFLTGSKENISHILKKLGSYSQNVEEHSTILLAGNVPAKRWTKIRPDAPPQLIAERLKDLAAGGAAAPKAE